MPCSQPSSMRNRSKGTFPKLSSNDLLILITFIVLLSLNPLSISFFLIMPRVKSGKNYKLPLGRHDNLLSRKVWYFAINVYKQYVLPQEDVTGVNGSVSAGVIFHSNNLFSWEHRFLNLFYISNKYKRKLSNIWSRCSFPVKW